MDNKFKKINAAEKIDWYYLINKWNSDRKKTAFIQGKNECVHHLKEALKYVEELTFEEFMELMRYKIK